MAGFVDLDDLSFCFLPLLQKATKRSSQTKLASWSDILAVKAIFPALHVGFLVFLVVELLFIFCHTIYILHTYVLTFGVITEV